MGRYGTYAVVCSAVLAFAASAVTPHEAAIEQANSNEFAVLAQQIRERESINRFASTTRQTAALIDDADRDPADLVVRRTAVLLAHLAAGHPEKDWSPFRAMVDTLSSRTRNLATNDPAPRFSLYLDACRVRRQVALSNPLLDFDKMLFVGHTRCGDNEGAGNHMCDQYFGFKATPGGGVYVLEHPFSSRPVLRDVLSNAVVASGRLAGKPLGRTGSFISPSLSYDGRRILFAYVERGGGAPWSTQNCYHVFSVNTDGGNLRQLTDGTWNEFDPCLMPNGRIVFISERRGGYGRCHGRPVPVYTLHTMNPDGTDIRCISYHESNEWHPSVNNDGMIVYTRWDYVDRGFNQAHHPWLTTPDGRDPRAIHGNYPQRIGSRPWMEMQVRAVPRSAKYVAIAAPHHGQSYGSIVLVDPRIADDDAMAPVRRITPDAAFPESEDNARYPYGMKYGTAWPLSEDFFLAVYDAASAVHGIWLVDSFGNREYIWRDSRTGCLSPIPLRSTPMPPMVAEATAGTTGSPPAMGVVSLMNVYDSLKPWPTNTRITALRIVQVLPKSTPHADNPRIGYGCQKNARAVLGTVPVEPDGSAQFILPSGKPVYFQALDANGMAVQSMRSATYVHPGEKLSCAGCHAPATRAPSLRPGTPEAMRRPPSPIVPDVDGSNPFSFPRLVQPVLDRRCVTCHSVNLGPNLYNQPGGENGWSRSYMTLRPFAFFVDGAAETSSRTTPGQFGARTSGLYRMLTNGHHGIVVKGEDMHRLALWLDCNSDFYGSYENTDAQRRGEVVKPAVE